MQLTKAAKVNIINGLTKTAFKARFDNMVQVAEAEALRRFEAIHGEAECYLRHTLTPDECRRFFGQHVDFSVKVPRGEAPYQYLKPPHVMPYNQSVGVLLGAYGGSAPKFRIDYLRTKENEMRSTIEPENFASIVAIINDVVELEAAATKFMADVANIVMSSCSTDTRLLELLPEAKPFLPVKEKRKDLVPVETINSVRETLNKKGCK